MIFEKLEEVEDRFTQVEASLGDGEIVRNQAAYQKLAKEHADLAPLIAKYRKLKTLTAAIRQNTELLEDPDPEMRDLARVEMQQLREQASQVEEEILVLLLPPLLSLAGQGAMPKLLCLVTSVLALLLSVEPFGAVLPWAIGMAIAAISVRERIHRLRAAGVPHLK